MPHTAAILVALLAALTLSGCLRRYYAPEPDTVQTPASAPAQATPVP